MHPPSISTPKKLLGSYSAALCTPKNDLDPRSVPWSEDHIMLLNEQSQLLNSRYHVILFWQNIHNLHAQKVQRETRHSLHGWRVGGGSHFLLRIFLDQRECGLARPGLRAARSPRPVIVQELRRAFAFLKGVKTKRKHMPQRAYMTHTT